MKRDTWQKNSLFLWKRPLFGWASLFIFGRSSYVTALIECNKRSQGQRVWCCWLSKTKCGLFDLVCSWKVCTNNLPPCSWNLVYDSSLQSPLNVKFVNSYCEIRVNSKIFCPHCVQSLATPCRYNSTIVGK